MVRHCADRGVYQIDLRRKILHWFGQVPNQPHHWSCAYDEDGDVDGNNDDDCDDDDDDYDVYVTEHLMVMIYMILIIRIYFV